MKKVIEFFKIEKKQIILEPEEGDIEKDVGVQKSFVSQFAENQNHQQRLFIQFLSSVLVVIVAYAYVYSNTASQKGIDVYRVSKTDTAAKSNILVNIKPEKFDSVKYDNGSIISYSQFSLLSIYVFAQIVLLILSIMILHMGYSFRRDQVVVNRIRTINLGRSTYDKVFGNRNFTGTGKGFLEYLPNFNSILFFSICIIQCVLFTSIFIYLKDFGNTEFYSIDKTYILPEYNINYKELRTSLIFPVLVNLFTYTYYYNKYEFSVNNQDTYVPVIKNLKMTKIKIGVSVFIILVCISLLVYSFYEVSKIIHLWTFIYFYIIILLPILFYFFIRNSPNAASYSQAFQGLVYIVCGFLLLYHSYFYFSRHTVYSMENNNRVSILFCTASVGLFALGTFFGSSANKNSELTLLKYLKGYNRFLFVMLYVFLLVCFLKLKWLDYSVAWFFGIYSILIGRRTLIKWRVGDYEKDSHPDTAEAPQ